MDSRANGLVRVGEDEFVATCWGGAVYYIHNDGSHELLLDTRQEGIPAGINFYDSETGMMYMTTDQHNTVRAYRIR
ncbi:MAG: hypothetical protein Kow001_09800 [Acidobacteriota bacterium]